MSNKTQMKNTCETCRWYKRYGLTDEGCYVGDCYRYPPGIENEQDDRLRPRVSENSMCGEWQAKGIQHLESPPTDTDDLYKKATAEAVEDIPGVCDAAKQVKQRAEQILDHYEKKLLWEDHKEALLCATRGCIADHHEAVIAAVRDGFTDLCDADSVAWALKVIELEDKLAGCGVWQRHTLHAIAESAGVGVGDDLVLLSLPEVVSEMKTKLDSFEAKP